MRKVLLRISIAIVAAVLIASGGAHALRLRAGNLILVTGGGFSPKTLPKTKDAPIKLKGFAKISTVDGTRPSPLKRLILEFDKHGHVETRGLAKCTEWKLKFTTTAAARRHCPGAIVGTGFGTALVKLPEQKPIKASSALTIFNGPRKHGNPTVLAHAYLGEPVGPITYIVPIEIKTIHHGRYGFKTVANIPPIVKGKGSPLYGRLTIGRTWKYRGSTLSYANARCADGRLQARGQFIFKDGTFLKGTVFRPCKVRK